MNAEELAAECEARGDMAGARYWRHVEAVVNAAPPLCPEQVARLRVLIWSSDSEPASAA
ncbi:hypothetical protein ACH47Z_18095 [Streptomyces sp. NPDC020192]|uniref:hypothetical protein n=1 Tax=Streptomyces sp. NPDC020192 TaxID=3365066 RepID=UPI00378E9F0D